MTQSTASTSLWNHVTHSSPGQVLLLSECMAQFGVSIQEAEATLATALAAGLLEPVFTLHGGDDAIRQATWTPDLQALRRQFEVEDHRVVDGRDPRNVAVGFRRTPAAARR